MPIKRAVLLIATFTFFCPAPPIATAEEFIPLSEFVAQDGLDGDAIYSRLLENRFNSCDQRLSMHSAGARGSYQAVELRLRYKNYRKVDEKIVSKTIAKYFAPQDVRHLGYLVINKREGPDDQFVYRPSARKVRRVNVRGEAVAGTDFAFEDIVPQEFEDGAHYRLPDETVDGIDSYVVAVVPRLGSDSEYSKLVLYIEKQHHVPIRTRYWDNRRVNIKLLSARPESITRYEDVEDGAPKEVWIANESRMEHLKLDSSTVLRIIELRADPGLRDRDFSQRQLTSSR